MKTLSIENTGFQLKRFALLGMSGLGKTFISRTSQSDSLNFLVAGFPSQSAENVMLSIITNITCNGINLHEI